MVLFFFLVLSLLTAGYSIFSVLSDLSAISSSEFRDVRASLTPFGGEIFFLDAMISLGMATSGLMSFLVKVDTVELHYICIM